MRGSRGTTPIPALAFRGVLADRAVRGFSGETGMDYILRNVHPGAIGQHKTRQPVSRPDRGYTAWSQPLIVL
jgi:hypothetical protein